MMHDEVILQALSQGKKKFAEFNRQLIEQLVGVRKIVTPLIAIVAAALSRSRSWRLIVAQF